MVYKEIWKSTPEVWHTDLQTLIAKLGKLDLEFTCADWNLVVHRNACVWPYLIIKSKTGQVNIEFFKNSI